MAGKLYEMHLSLLWLKICVVWENMPRSDFPDLLWRLSNCSEYSSSCTERRSKISLDLLHLWVGLPIVKTKTFLWVIYTLCFQQFKTSQWHFHFIFIFSSGESRHPSVSSISCDQSLARMVPGCFGKGVDASLWQGLRNISLDWVGVVRQEA